MHQRETKKNPKISNNATKEFIPDQSSFNDELRSGPDARQKKHTTAPGEHTLILHELCIKIPREGGAHQQYHCFHAHLVSLFYVDCTYGNNVFLFNNTHKWVYRERGSTGRFTSHYWWMVGRQMHSSDRDYLGHFGQRFLSVFSVFLGFHFFFFKSAKPEAKFYQPQRDRRTISVYQLFVFWSILFPVHSNTTNINQKPCLKNTLV